ncbi:TonB-dependent receptor [Sphingobium sp. TomTYG45]
MSKNLKLMALIATMSSTTAVYAAPTPADPAYPDAPASSASPEQGLGDIIVTAQRRSENLQKVPIAISAMTSEALANTGVTQLNDLTAMISGFAGPGDNSNRPPHLRGVGSQTNVDGNDSAVAYSIDGVFLPTFNPAVLAINYVDRVEVLKGPQGTLFGRNSTGGLISVITRSPTDRFEAEGEAGYGNYDTVEGSFYAGGPLADGIKANLALQASRQGDGWGRNLPDGRDVHRKPLVFSARSKWLLEPTDGTKITLTGDYEQYKSVGGLTPHQVTGTVSAFGTRETAKDWDSNVDTIDRQKSESGGVSAKIEQDLGFATLVSLTAYRKTHALPKDLDYDATPIYAVNVTNDLRNRQFTQELQLIGNPGSRLQWQLGAYFLSSRDQVDTYLEGGLLAPALLDVAHARQRTRSLSAYGQGTYKLTDDTRLTLGLRYTKERRKMNGIEIATLPLAGGGTEDVEVANVDQRVSQGVVTWRAAIDHDFGPDTLGYASINKGFKSGGFNLDVITNPPYKAEELISYEAGVKTSLLDRKLRLNVAGFYYDYSNIQIVGLGATSLVLYNGPKARIYGADVDIDAQVTPRLTLSGNFELMKSKFGDFDQAVFYRPLPGGGYEQYADNARGNKLPLAPGFTGSLTGVYKIPTDHGEWQLVGTVSHNSGFYTEVDNRLRQPAYTLLAANIRYTLPGDRVYVKLWGENLTNEKVVNFLATTTLSTAVVLDAPRTYGFTVGFKY